MSDRDACTALRLTLANVHRDLAERYRDAWPLLADKHDAVSALLEAAAAHTSRPATPSLRPGRGDHPHSHRNGGTT